MLTYHVMLASGIQQSTSVLYIYIGSYTQSHSKQSYPGFCVNICIHVSWINNLGRGCWLCVKCVSCLQWTADYFPRVVVPSQITLLPLWSPRAAWSSVSDSETFLADSLTSFPESCHQGSSLPFTTIHFSWLCNFKDAWE